MLDKNLLTILLPSLILLSYVWRYAFFREGKLYVGSIKNPNDYAIYALFIILLVLSMVRTGFPNATAIGITNDITLLLLVNFATYFLTTTFFRKLPIHKAINKSVLVTILSPSLLIVLLVVTYVLRYDSLPNVEGNFRSEPLFLNLLGLHLKSKEIVFREGMGRVHPNTFGIYAGSLFVAFVLALRYMDLGRKLKIMLWGVVFALLFAIIIADSRVTVFNALCTPLLIVILVSIRKFKILPYVTLLIPLFPLLSLLILENIADWEIMSAFSKNVHDIETGSARATIWKYCFEKMADIKAIHLIGYGEYGHYLSGASLLYDVVFNPDEDFSLMVTHNVFFQVFFDMGYLGVIIYISMLFMLIKCTLYLYQRGETYALALLGFMLYYVFSGVFESAFGSYNRFYFYLFMAVSVLILVLKNQFIKHQLELKADETDTTSVEKNDQQLSLSRH